MHDRQRKEQAEVLRAWFQEATSGQKTREKMRWLFSVYQEYIGRLIAASLISSAPAEYLIRGQLFQALLMGSDVIREVLQNMEDPEEVMDQWNVFVSYLDDIVVGNSKSMIKEIEPRFRAVSQAILDRLSLEEQN